MYVRTDGYNLPAFRPYECTYLHYMAVKLNKMYIHSKQPALKNDQQQNV